MPGPLTGYRVVEIAAVIAGPLGGSILADQGAEVLKVEAPGIGDVLRVHGSRRNGFSAMFASFNRSKRSIVVDLRRPEGVDLVKAIARQSDVLIQNMRPGALERIGLGYEAVRAVNERLVYASVTGFGSEGPLSNQPAYDTVLQGMTGLAWTQRDRSSESYHIVRLPIVDLVTGIQLSQAVTAALLERERSGRGQHVEVSLLASALALTVPVGMPDRVLQGEGVERFPSVCDVEYLHATADGWIVILPGTDAHCRAVAEAAGREDWLENPRFATVTARQEHFAEWAHELNGAFTGRTTAEWMELLEGEVPIAPALDPEQMFAHDGIRRSNVLSEREHPVAGRMIEVRPPAVFERTPGDPPTAAPTLGEDTDVILRELGIDDDRIEILRRERVVA